jgi:hypothetical protein
MRGWFRPTAAIAATAALAAGCGSSQTTSRSASPTTSQSTSQSASSHAAGLAPIPGCHGSQLAATYAGTDGATGHLEVTIALRNTSPVACRLHGYPRAALLDATGRPLPLRLRRGSGFFPDARAKPRPVVVAPGVTAHFGIGLITNNEYARAHVCHTAAAAMAAAPAAPVRWDRVSLRRAPVIRPCGSTLTVSPVHA